LKGSLLWEIRIRGKDNIRLLYAVYMEKAILILHGFVKRHKRLHKKKWTSLWKDIKTGRKGIDN